MRSLRLRSISVTTMLKKVDFPGWNERSNPRPTPLRCGLIHGYAMQRWKKQQQPHPIWHTTLLRCWIKVNDVDLTSQQRRVSNGLLQVNNSYRCNLPLHCSKVLRWSTRTKTNQIQLGCPSSQTQSNLLVQQSAMQRQTAVTAHLKNKQLLLFAFAARKNNPARAVLSRCVVCCSSHQNIIFSFFSDIDLTCALGAFSSRFLDLISNLAIRPRFFWGAVLTWVACMLIE